MILAGPAGMVEDRDSDRHYDTDDGDFDGLDEDAAEDSASASRGSNDPWSASEELEWHADALEAVRADSKWGDFNVDRAVRAIIAAQAFLEERRHEFEGPYALLTFDELVDEVQDLVDATVSDIDAIEAAHDAIEADVVRRAQERVVRRHRRCTFEGVDYRGHRAGFKPYRRAQL